MNVRPTALSTALILFVAVAAGVLVGSTLKERIEERTMRRHYDEIQRRIEQQQIAAECYGAAHKQDHVALDLDFTKLMNDLNSGMWR